MFCSGLRIGAAIFAAGVFILGFAFPAMAGNELSQDRNFGGEIFRAEPSSILHGQGLMGLRPQSSSERHEDIGAVAHTHLRLIVPPNGEVRPVSHDESTKNFRRHLENLNKNAGTPSATPNTILVLNTPSSIACIYNLVAQPANQPAGCNAAYTTKNPVGGGGAIAIVDAYHDPTAASDLAYFSQFFGLPAPNFQVVYAGGKAPYITGPKPRWNSGWSLEEALDVEWAHTMAPAAKIYLVEAQNNSLSALFTAVVAAEYLVSQSGGGEISMSWGSSEFSGETAWDQYFSSSGLSNIVFVASSGDIGSVVSYPAASPYVIGAGGTTINRDSNGNFVSETTWSGSGGGISCCETRPSYQSTQALQAVVGSHRGTPDISLDANPSSGVAVYLAGQWYIVGGTSVSAPAIAGILNVADSAGKSFPAANTEIGTIYTNGSTSADFRDIALNSCGSHGATAGYDLCTGWGSPITYIGK